MPQIMSTAQEAEERAEELFRHRSKLWRGEINRDFVDLIARNCAAADPSDPMVFSRVRSSLLSGTSTPEDYIKAMIRGRKARNAHNNMFATLATSWDKVIENMPKQQGIFALRFREALA